MAGRVRRCLRLTSLSSRPTTSTRFVVGLSMCAASSLRHSLGMTSSLLVPVFEHDCDGCTFLGHVTGKDLWFCPQAGSPTVIARWSSDGPEYESMSPLSAGLSPALTAARNLAAARGLF